MGKKKPGHKHNIYGNKRSQTFMNINIRFTACFDCIFNLFFLTSYVKIVQNSLMTGSHTCFDKRCRIKYNSLYHVLRFWYMLTKTFLHDFILQSVVNNMPNFQKQQFLQVFFPQNSAKTVHRNWKTNWETLIWYMSPPTMLMPTEILKTLEIKVLSQFKNLVLVQNHNMHCRV